MLEQYKCEDCSMFFDSSQALTTHQAKFCIHSQYANLDSLTKEYDQLQANSNKQSLPQPNNYQYASRLATEPRFQSMTNDLDKEYLELLKQIGDREDVRKKMEREKWAAEQELAILQKKEKELFLDAKRTQLQEVIKKRENLIGEEDQLQKEIKNFQKERKEESRARQLNTDDDYAYREGREAGKLVMQRRLLEEKKRDIEASLKAKKRQQERINREIGAIKDEPIYIPEYRQKQKIEKKELSQVYQNNYPSPNKSLPIKDSYPPKPVGLRETQPKEVLYTESPIKQSPSIKKQNISEVNSSKKSLLGVVDDEYLKAALFSGKEKTLFESLNPKGKSDEDIFIESLVAQEYDALNVLARLPKDSQLYAIKLKQFQEMSRIRQELKDKIQKVRLDKVRREFEMEKQMTETEKANIQWLDKNRRNMLNREVDILQNQARQQQQLESEPLNNPSIDPTVARLPTSNPQLRQQPASLQSIRSPDVPSINNIPQRALQSQPGLRGYRITIKSIQGYGSGTPMCVRVAVMEQGQTNGKGGKWIFNTKYHDSSAPKDDRNPYNPAIRNRLDEAGAVVFNEQFEIKEDLQNRYNNYQNEIYLWVMVMQKDDLRLSNEPELYLWYCFKLTHFGHLREGVFTLSLFHDNFPFPDPPDMNKMKGKANEQITIQLNECVLSEEKPPQLNNPRTRTGMRAPQRVATGTTAQQTNRNTSNPIPRNTSTGLRTMKVQQTEKKPNSLKNIKEEFFIQNETPSEFEPVKEGKKLSFDFSVTALRTLPSHIGPVKLEIRFLDYQNDQVIGAEEVLAEFTTDMYNPLVNFTKKIRNLSLPSSTVAIIKVMGVSTLSYEPGLLGFSYFHLGFDEGGFALEKDKDNYFLINGCYQLPVFWGNTDSYLSLEKLHQMFPFIPCFSILVCVGLPQQGRLNFPYSEGIYNTIFMDVDESSYRLFREQFKRQQQKTLDYVNGYYKFKGVKVDDYSEQDLRKLLGQALAFKKENTDNLFRLQAMAEYSSTFGVRVGIDCVKLPPGQTNYYYFCTACIYPPAKYYNEEENDLDFFYIFDLASSLTSTLVFSHPVLAYYPPYDPNYALILELSRIKLNSAGLPDSGVQTCGFTVLQLFDLRQSVACVDVRVRELKLLEGEFDKRQLKNLQSNSVRYIELMQGQKKSGFGLTVRILNGFWENQLGVEIGGGQGKSLRSLFQNSKGFRSAQETAKKIIEDTYGVTLV